MKSCEDCKYYDGYNYWDGIVYCKRKGGYENCPYDDETSI